jgi:hypothetical protein
MQDLTPWPVIDGEKSPGRVEVLDDKEWLCMMAPYRLALLPISFISISWPASAQYTIKITKELRNGC